MIQKFLASLRKLFLSVRKGFMGLVKRFGWLKVTIGVVVILIAVLTLLHFVGGKGPEQVTLNETRTVELKSVAELSSDSSPLSIAGVVSSESEASVRSEVGGQITAVNYSLGDYVAAGSVVAQVENASQRASVAQAQGAVAAASAGASVSQTSLGSAKQGAVNALLSAYGTVDKTVRADLDPMFSNPQTVQPQFLVQSSDSQSKINTENMRLSIGSMLTRENTLSSSLSVNSNLDAELTATQQELRQLRDFLDTILRTLNAGIPSGSISASTISTYISTANADRSAIVAALGALASAQSGLETAGTGANTQSGSAAASLVQAQAGLAAARANLEKTIVRAPISGSINSLSLKVGDYLSAGAIAVVIANNGALEITAYVTDTDAKQIAVGGKATIDAGNGAAEGVVTHIAPAIDPATKKVEVRIGITMGEKNLLNGQSVSVSIERAQPAASSTSTIITLPLSALKVGADNITVFTVDTNNTLVPHVVTLGELLGDRVVIATGLTSDMRLVTDARGLQPGQTVIVK